MIAPLRIVRGILGTALTWALPWAIAGALLRIIAPAEEGPFPTVTMLGWSAIYLGSQGAVLGAFFAAFIALGGQRRFAALTIPDMALIGAVASLMMPAAALASWGFQVPSDLMTYFVGQTIVHAALGASSAAATLWLFRRGDQPPHAPGELELAASAVLMDESLPNHIIR